MKTYDSSRKQFSKEFNLTETKPHSQQSVHFCTNLRNKTNDKILISMREFFSPRYFDSSQLVKHQQQDLATFLLAFYPRMKENELREFLKNCQTRSFNPIRVLPLRFLLEKVITLRTPDRPQFSPMTQLLLINYLQWTNFATEDLSSYMQFVTQECQRHPFPSEFWNGYTLSLFFHSFRELSLRGEVEELFYLVHQQIDAKLRTEPVPITVPQLATILRGISYMPVSITIQSLLNQLIPQLVTPPSDDFFSTTKLSKREEATVWASRVFSHAIYAMKDLPVTNSFTKQYLTFLLQKIRDDPKPIVFTSEEMILIVKGVQQLDIIDPLVEEISDYLQLSVRVNGRQGRSSFTIPQLIELLELWKVPLGTYTQRKINRNHRYDGSRFSQLLFTIYEHLPLSLWFLPTPEIEANLDVSKSKEVMKKYQAINGILAAHSLIPYHFFRQSDVLLSQFFQLLTQRLQSEATTTSLNKQQLLSIFALFPYRECSPSEQPVVFALLEVLYRQYLNGGPSSLMQQLSVDELTLIFSHCQYLLRYHSLAPQLVTEVITVFHDGLQRRAKQWESLKESPTFFSPTQIQRIVRGCQLLPGDTNNRAEVFQLLQWLTGYLQEMNMKSFLMTLQAMSGMSSDVPEIRSFLKALAQSRMNETTVTTPEEGDNKKELEPIGFLAGAYYGLRSMSCRYREVETILQLLNSRWMYHSIPTELVPSLSMTKALTSLMIGIEQMQLSDSIEVRKVIIIITTILSAMKYPPVPSNLARLLYGLRKYSMHQFEIRKLIVALTHQITKLDEMKVKQYEFLVRMREKELRKRSDSNTFWTSTPQNLTIIFEKYQPEFKEFLTRHQMFNLLSYGQIEYDSIFTMEELQQCLQGIVHFERYTYPELEALISALHIQIAKIGYGKEQALL